MLRLPILLVLFNLLVMDHGFAFVATPNPEDDFAVIGEQESIGLMLLGGCNGSECDGKLFDQGDGSHSFVNQQMDGCLLDAHNRLQRCAQPNRSQPNQSQDENRDELEEAIRQKYDGRVILGNQFDSPQAAPIALDAWMFGGYLSPQWAKSELAKLGIDAARFLEETDFEPSREELIGDYLAAQVWDAREEQSLMAYIPYLAIRSKDSDAPKRSAFRVLSIDHPDLYLSQIGPAHRGEKERNVVLLSGEESDGPRSSWIFHEVESGIFEIENAVNRNWFLGQADQAQDQTESLNVQLTEADAPDSPPAKWILHHIDHGMYYVENADHPGMYLSHPSEESRDSNIRNVKLASEDDPDWNRSIWMLAGVDQ